MLNFLKCRSRPLNYPNHWLSQCFVSLFSETACEVAMHKKYLTATLLSLILLEFWYHHDPRLSV